MLQLMSSRDTIIPRSRLPACACAAEQQPAADGEYVATLKMSMANCAIHSFTRFTHSLTIAQSLLSITITHFLSLHHHHPLPLFPLPSPTPFLSITITHYLPLRHTVTLLSITTNRFTQSLIVVGNTYFSGTPKACIWHFNVWNQIFIRFYSCT